MSKVKKVPLVANDKMIDATFRETSQIKHDLYARRFRAKIYEKMVKAYIGDQQDELRKNYRASILNFLPIAQKMAQHGMILRIVSAGSLYVTISLTETELEIISAITHIELDS